MNKKVFSQLDSRWGKLPYPYKPYTLSTSGCGCCSVTHVIIETAKYKNYTPAKVQPYMKQFAVAKQGTQWAGITKSLQHYGFTVINHPTMDDLFRTLDKRKQRLGIILFRGGTKGGITWTTGGHYVAFTDYKVKNGKHYFYTKDSGGRRHTGTYCYETQMAGLIPQVWSALPKVKKTSGQKLCDEAKQVTAYMKEHDFKYYASMKYLSPTWEGAKKKRTTNCAIQVCYDLQNMGVFKPGEYFYIDGDTIHCMGGLTMEKLKKVATILHPHKVPQSAGLKQGDICGYGKSKNTKQNPHTQIYDRFNSNNNPVWYSTGGNGDIQQGKAHTKKSYNKKVICTVIRLK